MIQDIAPHRYDNTYHIQKPGAQDYVFCIQKGRILLRETAEEHVLTIPRREEIEAAVPELINGRSISFRLMRSHIFWSVCRKRAEEILAKLKEGAGQMPVSDKNNMEAGKTDSGTLEGAGRKRVGTALLCMENADRHPCDGADAPGICSDHGGAAVALETGAVSSAGAVGQRRRTARSSGRSSARSAARRNIQRSPRQSSWRSRTGTNCLCRATASTTVPTVDMR